MIKVMILNLSRYQRSVRFRDRSEERIERERERGERREREREREREEGRGGTYLWLPQLSNLPQGSPHVVTLTSELHRTVATLLPQ